jgi:hypothetical protein
MKGMYGSRRRALAWLASLVVVIVAFLGWEPSPWQGQVHVCRSEYHRAKIPYEPGMRVNDVLARSRATLGEAANETVVVYRWRPWLIERVPDAIVMGMQSTLYALSLHQWSSALWWWWDGIVPRQEKWREIARDGTVREQLVQSGEMIVLHVRR